MAKLAENGVVNDAAAVQVVSEQAPCVDGRMNHPQDISNTLWAIASASFAICLNIEECGDLQCANTGNRNHSADPPRPSVQKGFCFPCLHIADLLHPSMF
jgi:hypothetical protein